MLTRAFSAVSLLGCAGCTLSSPEGPIVYAEVPDALADGGVHELTLDIAVPDADVYGEGPFPAIIWIHGGGWHQGDLYDEAGSDVIESGPEQGYVGLSINYRLTDELDENGDPRFPWPAQIEDARCAVRWLSSQSDVYGVDPDRIAVAGYSGTVAQQPLVLSADLRRPASPEILEVSRYSFVFQEPLCLHLSADNQSVS